MKCKECKWREGVVYFRLQQYNSFGVASLKLVCKNCLASLKAKSRQAIGRKYYRHKRTERIAYAQKYYEKNKAKILLRLAEKYNDKIKRRASLSTGKPAVYTGF